MPYLAFVDDQWEGGHSDGLHGGVKTLRHAQKKTGFPPVEPRARMPVVVSPMTGADVSVRRQNVLRSRQSTRGSLAEIREASDPLSSCWWNQDRLSG